MKSDTTWFKNAKWGVFMHYLADTASNSSAIDLSPDEWNRQIDAFDVEALASQLNEIKAGYFFITLGQNSGFFLSPNSTYDRLVGRNPSRCSKRDLVADLYMALAKYDIPLMVYLPSHSPNLDKQAVTNLKCTPKWDATAWCLHPGTYLSDASVDERLSEFQRNWEAVISEWSIRWGDRVKGWWIDGCYFADKLYRHSDEPNFSSFVKSMKAGNKDSIVAFNGGVKTQVISITESEDYTAGEISQELPINGMPPYGYQMSRFIDGAQFHILSYLGRWWGQGEPRFDKELLIGFSKHINSFEGVVTWDIPPTRKGTLDNSHIEHLKALGKATRLSQ